MSSHSMIFISKDVCQTSFVLAPVQALKQDPYLFTKKKKKNQIMKGNLKCREWQWLYHTHHRAASCNCSLLELCAEESEAASGLREQIWLAEEGSQLYMCYLSDVLARVGQLSLGKTVVTNSRHPSIANISKGPFLTLINRGIGMSVAQNKDRS